MWCDKWQYNYRYNTCTLAGLFTTLPAGSLRTAFTFPHAGISEVQQSSNYQYTPKLKALAGCAPLNPSRLPASLTQIVTPLNWRAWQLALQSHPDRDFASYIVAGIRDGFKVGFNYHKTSKLRSKPRNIGSAYAHPDVVSKYLSDECEYGRILGPFSSPPIPIHTSSFGVIPKRHQHNKWRLIVDLSSPEYHSVNDGIDTNLCSFSYISMTTLHRQFWT